MELVYWHRQTADKPLFPDLLWSRPENRQHAGKLLIVGGNLHGFAVPATAYQTAVQTGLGIAKVLLPDGLRKIVGQAFEAAEFAPSTPSGSFSQKALAELLDLSHWADTTLLAGELGRNSETAVLLETFLQKYDGALALTRDAIDYFRHTPQTLLSRPQTLVVCSLGQLQKLGQNAKFIKPFAFGMDLLHLVEALHELTSLYPCHIVTKHLGNFFVASGGQVSTTKIEEERKIWRVSVATAATVWWLQNPNQTFQALTTALLPTSAI